MSFEGNPCFEAAFAAARGRLPKGDVDAAFAAVERIRKRLGASGEIDRMGERLTAAVEREAERIRVAAALQKRHAALNVLVRDRLHRTVDAFQAAGLSRRQALLAIMEGTQQGVAGGRDSVAALRQAYEARYQGELVAEIERDRPHVRSLLHDRAFDAAVTREMHELREGGQPGITGDADAQWLAAAFAKHAERSRVELNRLGASIGKLDGWSGAQTHDDVAMIQAGKEAWMRETLPLLDVERTFPDVEDEAEIRDILGSVYDTIITGLPAHERPNPNARVNPASLAKSLGKSRVLHFRDADAALVYRDRFGYGTTITGLLAHQRRAAHMAAVMERLGPNPEAMIAGLVERLKHDIRDDATLSPEAKARGVAELSLDGSDIRQALDIATGLASRPVNASVAKFGAEARAWASLTKLGGAVISSIPSDTVTAAAAASFRGRSFLGGLVEQIGGLFEGRSNAEMREIAALIGEGHDGLLGWIASQADAEDGRAGFFSRRLDTFFKWSGLTAWTDAARASAGRMLSREMATRMAAGWDQLPPRYRHVLELHNIDATRWELIRAAGARDVNGTGYFTPDRIRELSGDQVRPLAQETIDRLDAALAERAAKRDARDQEEAGWIAGRARKLEEGMSAARQRLDASLKRLGERGDDAAQRVDEMAFDLASKLDDIAKEYATRERTTKATARARGRDEGWIERRIQEMRNRIAEIDRETQRLGADRAADFLADWQVRRDDLSQFVDRMERNKAARAEENAADLAAQPGRIDQAIGDARRDLEMAVRRFFADEMGYAVIESDAASRRLASLGTRPGTLAGELVRFLVQFKGFPLAYTQRVLGRAVFGHEGGTRWQRLAAGLPHLGVIMAASTVAGYISMTMKDAARGYWPPREPSLKTFLAALVQGGGAGIYGDFLFGETQRFGGGVASTLLGPVPGAAASLIENYQRARSGDAKAGDWIDKVVNNTPFANLFYVRPLLDTLFLTALRDWASPGLLTRQDRRRMDDYGQHRFIPRLTMEGPR
jgi:hypothetical protein